MVSHCKVLKNEEVATDTMHIELDASGLEANRFWPGRFAHVRPFHRDDLILRRPISINAYDKDTQVLELIYQRKGGGTQSLAQAKPGDELDVLGPNGNGFFAPKGARRIWALGGGIGCAPLKYLPTYYPDIAFEAFVGYRNADCCYQLDEFEQLFKRVSLTTDDGSAGEKDFVTSVLQRRLETGDRPDAIFACGPPPMVRALARALDAFRDVPCMVSLEERMGCGVGACYTCTCSIKRDGRKKNARVCVEGPVFSLWEVDFDA